MTMLASPASDRAMARQATENGTPPAGTQEIKYRQDAANYVAAMVAQAQAMSFPHVSARGCSVYAMCRRGCKSW